MDGVSWADERLLVAKAVTDPTAFADIYDHYFSRVCNYVRCRVRDAPTTEGDGVQVFSGLGPCYVLVLSTFPLHSLFPQPSSSSLCFQPLFTRILLLFASLKPNLADL